jgi:hypothetical protein
LINRMTRRVLTSDHCEIMNVLVHAQRVDWHPDMRMRENTRMMWRVQVCFDPAQRTTFSHSHSYTNTHPHTHIPPSSSSSPGVHLEKPRPVVGLVGIRWERGRVRKRARLPHPLPTTSSVQSKHKAFRLVLQLRVGRRPVSQRCRHGDVPRRAIHDRAPCHENRTTVSAVKPRRFGGRF